MINKKHKYRGKYIENVPYGSQARWFILEENGERTVYSNGSKIYPTSTLKGAKELVDIILKEESTRE